MFRDLIQFARESGADRIAARYIQTAKNGLVAQLLPQFGFAQAGQTGEFLLDVSSAKCSECKFLYEAKVA
jgi:predicted enzyme involved in methoxymalonyl-ACP biosynthesis